MTLIGKLLVYLELLIAVGFATIATGMYTNKKIWFDQIADASIDKGSSPVSFPQLAAEIDSLGKQAAVASKNWGEEEKGLRAREDMRRDRQKEMTKLLARARTAKGGAADPAFYELKEDPTTRLLDVFNPGDPVTVLRPNELKEPVGGSETLLDQFKTHAKAADELTAEIRKLRVGARADDPPGDIEKYKDNQRTLGVQVAAMELRLQQGVIRENLYNEAAHLAAFEVNAGEQLDTVTRRRQQLRDRLVPFRGSPMKQPD